MALLTEREEQLLIRTLAKKIGPVDMDLVIGEAEYQGKHMIKLAGRRVEDGEAVALQREAEMLTKMKLWKVFTETLRYQAEQMMFVNSKKAEDVFVSGKMLLHAISTLEHIIWACQNPMLLADQKKQLSTPKRRRPLPKGEKGVIN